jgi:hypothetical protein
LTNVKDKKLHLSPYVRLHRPDQLGIAKRSEKVAISSFLAAVPALNSI